MDGTDVPTSQRGLPVWSQGLHVAGVAFSIDPTHVSSLSLPGQVGLAFSRAGLNSFSHVLSV